MELQLAERSIRNGRVEISVKLTRSDGADERLWFAVPEKYGDYLTERADPFVLASLFVAMRRGEELRVYGTVSTELLNNLEEFQAAWCNWRPGRYKRIDITAEEELGAGNLGNRRAIQTFSGGVDSAFTALQHARNGARRAALDLKAAIMIHGFDIPLDEHTAYRSIYERSQPILLELGIELIPLATNFRDLWHRQLRDWEDAFGTGMGACLMLLSDDFQHGLIASSEPYNSLLLPWGSNPVTDLMMSSDVFRIHHDAAAYTRNEKVARLAKEWPEGADNLRVCWQGPKKDQNCCRCEKCIRTVLNFQLAAGKIPRAFGRRVSPQHIRSLRGLAEAHINPLRQILDEARKKEMVADWIEALADCISRNEEDLEQGLTPQGSLPELVTDDLE